MPEQRLINTLRSADLVTSKILIGGTELSAACQVINLVVEKEVNRVPTARIELIDGDPASQDFPLSNQDLLIPGNEVDIQAGYHNDHESIFKGIVIRHSLKIRGGQAYLVVECKDAAVKMTIGRRNKYFYDRKDSEIIEEIAGSYGLTSEVEASSVQHPELVQYQATDWDFCVVRAQANGKVVIPDGGTLNVKKPDFAQTEVETVSFGATLLDFDAEIDARWQFQKVTAHGWNPADQEMLSIEAADPSVSLNSNLSASDLSAVVGLDDLQLKSGGVNNDSVLQQWADAKALFNQLAKVRGRVRFQGIAGVKPDTTLKLEGVGDRFNGKVYVSAVRHQISEGNWTVDAQFGINPTWFSESADVNEVPAAGLLPAVNGLQIGLVTQLESDPEGENRIKVNLPMVSGDEQGIWARVATLDAGKERGSFFLPEIGDEVLLGFVNASPNDAIVLGMLNSSNKPAPLTASDDNHEKGFVTRSGIKFIFNDDKKSVVLETPGGKKIRVDEDADEIVLEDDHSNVVKLNPDGISLDSPKDIKLKASGDVTIEGLNVSAKATAQFKAEGSAGAELSTSAVAIIKGSQVMIN